jgi:hypothetical protein
MKSNGLCAQNAQSRLRTCAAPVRRYIVKLSLKGHRRLVRLTEKIFAISKRIVLMHNRLVRCQAQLCFFRASAVP